MYTIGQFSRLTALTVKTLRHYHERGLLFPTSVDGTTGYRFYDRKALERARIIVALRSLDFPLDEIAQILMDCADDGDVVDFLESHQQVIRTKIERYQGIKNTLDGVIAYEREAKHIMSHTFQIEEKSTQPQLIAGIRARGRYVDSAERFKKLGRAYGFGINGKAGNLIYDTEYKETDADFESFFPIKKEKPCEGIEVSTLPPARLIALIHRGPYETLHSTYARLLDELERREWKQSGPSREIYIRGPGMIFRGNPKNYVTEIQIPV